MRSLSRRLMHKALQACGYDVTRCGDSVVVVRRRANYFPQDRTFNKFLLEQHLAFILRQYGVNGVLDVGANIGQYALGLRRWGYEGEIISFEPVRAVYEVLRDVARHDPKWRVYPVALGRQSGVAQMYVTHSPLFSSLLKLTPYVQERFGRGSRVQRVEEVTVRRLDALLAEATAPIRQPRLFLKMDTQGYDLAVWEGLGAQRDLVVGLQSEVSVVPLYEGMPSMWQAVAAYAAQGFQLSGLFPVSREEPTARVIEFDCVMVRTP